MPEAPPVTSTFAFLKAVVAEARRRLELEGRLLLAISEEETASLAQVEGVRVARVWPIPSMVRQQIAELRFAGSP